VNEWLEARLREAETVRVGSTYKDVVKFFRRDGGLVERGKHRLVSVLCPYLKIDVEFDSGAKHPVPADAKVTAVSKPYFEREFGD
jgi:hypothetical protein